MTDEIPRRPKSAYLIFMHVYREEHQKRYPDQAFVFSEFSTNCAARWRELMDEEKRHFSELAKQDKERYDNEMLIHIVSTAEAISATRRDRHDIQRVPAGPVAPKRPLSSFMWYSIVENTKLQGTMPGAGAGAIAQEVGRRWRNASAETRAPYEALAMKDKARYMRETREYINAKRLLCATREPEDEKEDREEVGK